MLPLSTVNRRDRGVGCCWRRRAAMSFSFCGLFRARGWRVLLHAKRGNLDWGNAIGKPSPMYTYLLPSLGIRNVTNLYRAFLRAVRRAQQLPRCILKQGFHRNVTHFTRNRNASHPQETFSRDETRRRSSSKPFERSDEHKTTKTVTTSSTVLVPDYSYSLIL